MSRTVRSIAVFEAAKGAAVLLAGCGALSLLHTDVQQFANALLSHFHLNPAKHYPSIFLDAAAALTDSRLWLLALLAAVYGCLRCIEAYGLWHERRWAEWLAVVSGGLYIPFELLEIARGFSWLAIGAVGINLLVVGLMSHALRRKNCAFPLRTDSAVNAPPRESAAAPRRERKRVHRRR